MLSPCNTIILETLPGDPMLNVVQKKTKHMGSMGVPTRNGHKMHIEEALFLVQCRKAMIRHQGTPLRLQECMYLLESCSLPLNKFTVYKNLKNLGHMIRISEEGFYDLFAAEGYSMSNKKLKPTCRVVYCPSADMTSDDLVNLVKKASEGTSAKIVLAKIRNGICTFVCAATGMIFEP